MKPLLTSLIFLMFISYASAQDECGCVRASQNAVLIPYAADGLTIKFYYRKKFEWQKVYTNWSEVLMDFPGSSSETVIRLDWSSLDWEYIHKKNGAVISIGPWLDDTRNHNPDVAIANIKTSCFIPQCSPGKYVFSMLVYLD